MNIGIFTDTYFPQVSGVATSILTLKNDLERKGHSVYIFTTTDPHANKDVIEPNVFRLPSVPFISFTDRRIAISGFFHAVEIAKELELDIVHTQTEFSMGMIGKYVANRLKIPCVHTYHTMYEDYLHYVLNGHLLRPYHVKQMTRMFVSHTAGVVAPSEQVRAVLDRYKIKTPITIIPTGVDISEFTKPVDTKALRRSLGIDDDAPVLLSLSRIAMEKKIGVTIGVMPQLIKKYPNIKLVIVGGGPDMDEIQQIAKDLDVMDHVIFTGEVKHDNVAPYYHMANLFVSASDTETQGLTCIEAISAGAKVVVRSAPYTDELLKDPAVGVTFEKDGQMLSSIEQYLDHPLSFEDKKSQRKILHDISSDTFGDSIIEFYQDAYKYFLKQKLSSTILNSEEFNDDQN
ncbi:glycosyl transferase [Companilactobacillus sp. RD055328]|uniref:glycosyltransferase family 4 protein n=1 Tax=Companilactobacillus sp. RD055328 TaxID=2916634 RepID=UPI001FC8A971|nr:glycosyltransferase family 4 protein [Companilactobacillus sp. RD055328]GKQ42458.1 glycosyl transferase [Companilactobacillus sp. RD055328]